MAFDSPEKQEELLSSYTDQRIATWTPLLNSNFEYQKGTPEELCDMTIRAFDRKATIYSWPFEVVHLHDTEKSRLLENADHANISARYIFGKAVVIEEHYTKPKGEDPGTRYWQMHFLPFGARSSEELKSARGGMSRREFFGTIQDEIFDDIESMQDLDVPKIILVEPNEDMENFLLKIHQEKPIILDKQVYNHFRDVQKTIYRLSPESINIIADVLLSRQYRE